MGPRAAIIFDFDGVLADSIGLYHRLYRQVAEHWGRPFPATTIEAFRDWYNPKWEENYRILGFTGFQREQAMQWVSERIDYSKVRLFPNVKDMVFRYAKLYPVAIASTTSDRKIRALLETEGIVDCFDIILGGGVDGSDKVTMVGEAWRQLGAPADRTVMVGDTSMDIMSARQWGLRSVGVTYGWMSAARLEPVRPTIMVHQPFLLETAINGLLADEE
jgi:phosphoglycolate phosphatase